jgi:hypothetical protein
MLDVTIIARLTPSNVMPFCPIWVLRSEMEEVSLDIAIIRQAGLPRLAFLGEVQIDDLVALPHSWFTLLEVDLGAVCPWVSQLRFPKAVVDVLSGEHDAPTNCIFAGIIELNGLEKLVGLALASMLGTSVHDASRLDRFHKGTVSSVLGV